MCELPACGDGSGCGGAEPRDDEDDKVAIASGTSKGFGRSRPSAVGRGVSCSSTDGHNLIIALEGGENDSEGRGEGDGVGVGWTARVGATECGAAGVL